jgi:hypothetical protein
MLVFCGCTHQSDAAFRAGSYRRIQTHEAAQTRAQRRILQMPKCDPSRRQESASVCAHSEAICELGDAIGEVDAAVRCAQSRDVCSATRAHAEVDCTQGAS